MSARQTRLDTIADEVQSWLDWQKSERDREGMETDDDIHVRSMPVYPTRGTLKNWIEVLSNMRDEEMAKNEGLGTLPKETYEDPAETGPLPERETDPLAGPDYAPDPLIVSPAETDGVARQRRERKMARLPPTIRGLLMERRQRLSNELADCNRLIEMIDRDPDLADTIALALRVIKI